MCCDGWNYGEAVGVCPACDKPVDAEGNAVEGCFWSPLICEICGARPCDQSC
jgi:hypothetical protein